MDLNLNIIWMNFYDVTLDMHLYFAEPFDCRDVALQRLNANNNGLLFKYIFNLFITMILSDTQKFCIPSRKFIFLKQNVLSWFRNNQRVAGDVAMQRLYQGIMDLILNIFPDEFLRCFNRTDICILVSRSIVETLNCNVSKP